MSATEIPVTFECENETLLGIVHVPAELGSASRGVLAMPAGGPQYRGGCCRQLLFLGRRLADAGTPVMRFDYRGIGDGSGRFVPFTEIEADLKAAVAKFRETVPGLSEVVLWGGCDAASASMIHGWKLPEVTGLALGNPYAHTEETGEQAMVKHYYLQRLREPAFWRKVLSLRFNPLPAIATVGRVLGRALRRHDSSGETSSADNFDSQPYPVRMRLGTERFGGHMLMLMSGRSIVSKEFDELVAADPAWPRALSNCKTMARHDLPEADQAFSTIAARDEIIEIAKTWLKSLPPPRAAD